MTSVPAETAGVQELICHVDMQIVPSDLAQPSSIAESMEAEDVSLPQPVKEPLQAASGTAQDKGTKVKGKNEEPYAEDTTDDSVQVTGSSEGGSGMWGWLKGLGGSKGQKSAHEIYKVSTTLIMLHNALGETCGVIHWHHWQIGQLPCIEYLA